MATRRPANVPVRHWEIYQARESGMTFRAVGVGHGISGNRARQVFILTAYRLMRGPGRWRRDPWPAKWHMDEMSAALAWYRDLGKPEVVEPPSPLIGVKLLAYWVPLTNRMLADAPLIRQIIDRRLAEWEG